MSNEIRYAREVYGAATPGPWVACAMDLYIFGGDGHMVADRPDDEDVSDALLRGRGHGAEVSGQRSEGQGVANIRAVALFGSTWEKTLAVIEAAGFMNMECTADFDCSPGVTCESEIALGGAGCDECMLRLALKACHTAIAEHRERGGE